MADAAPTPDDQLASALDAALVELKRTGGVDLPRLRARHGPAADEVPELLQALADFETAVADWQAVSTPAQCSTGPPAPAEPLPERIGRYRVRARLGAGGMGTVYRADDPDLQRVVAVKVPRVEGVGEDRRVRIQRFVREARVAAQIRHAHVCPIYDVGEESGVLYVVMQCIEGQSLAERLRGQQRIEDPKEAVELARQVAEALEAVHGHGIVHRDLKPGNILIDPAGQAILTDFGLARPEDDTEHLTTEGTLPGTPAYMAPEQAEAKPEQIGPWTDLYSLGVVLYQMLTGRLPFEGPVLTILRRIGHEAPPPPSALRPDLEPALESIILKAMAPRPEDRFQTAREFADALQGMKPQELKPARTPAPGAGRSGGGRRTWRRRLVLAAIVLLGVGLVTWGVYLFGTQLYWAALGIRWVKRARMPDARANMMATALDGHIYVVGGRFLDEGYPTTCCRYAVESDRWEVIGTLPAGTERLGPQDRWPPVLVPVPAIWRAEPQRSAGSMAAIGGKLYLAGGWGSWWDVARKTSAQMLPMDTLLIYDPALREWSFGQRIPVPEIKNELPGSAESTCGVIDGKIYLYTGTLGSREHQMTLFHVYDPHTGLWTALPTPSGGSFMRRAGGVIHGRFHLVGGGDGMGSHTNIHHIFDPSKKPATEGWTTGKPLPMPRSGAAGVVVGGKLFVIGGHVHVPRAENPLATVEIYDPATDSWSDGPPLPTPRTGHAAVAMGNTIYVFGGLDEVIALDVAELLKRKRD